MWKGPLAIIGAVFGLAILAVIVGKNSPAASAIGQAGSGLAQVITSAVNLNVSAGATNAAQQSSQTPSIQSVTAQTMNLGAFGEGLVTIVLAIIGLAVIATLVGKNAQTGNVLTAGAGGLAKDITAAQGPVLGGGGISSFGGVDLGNLLGS